MVRSWRNAAWLLSGAVLGGCALIPGVPVGPSHGPSVRLGVTSGYAYGHASVQLSELERTRRLTVNSASYGGNLPSPLPQRLTARFSTGPWLDVGADLGWTSRGLQLRGGPLHVARRLPLGVELEWRSGSSSDVADDALIDRARVVRARFELYPPLPLGRAEDGWPRGFGVIAAGMSHGEQLLSLSLPREYNSPDDALFGSYRSAAMNVLRTETRAELALGVHWRSLPVTGALVLLPWITLAQRGREVSCPECTPVELEQLSASWGIALALDAGVLLRTAD